MLTFYITMKGGSGKSTTICNMAPLVARRSVTGIVDRDPNGTTAQWLAYRGETKLKPIPGIHEFENTEEAFQRILTFMEEHDHVMFDMPGQDNPESRALLYYLAETSGRLMRFIVPVKPSQADINLLPKAQDLIATIRGKRIQAGLPDVESFYVINEAPNTTAQERKDTVLAMASIGITPIPSHIHARKAFRDSLASGESVTEMPKKARAEKAAEEITAVYQDIFRATTSRQSKDNRRTMEAQTW